MLASKIICKNIYIPQVVVECPPSTSLHLHLCLHLPLPPPPSASLALLLLPLPPSAFFLLLGSSGDHLFLLVFMLAPKIICKNMYSKSPTGPGE
jgi:hypothetical protein